MTKIQTRQKVERLLEEMGKGALEREEVIGLSFLSAAAGESIFLLGLPGVAKSMVARRLGLAFKDARRFEYLMSRFSTPDEIFGPVSISKLKDADTYERVVDGYLPTADVVFLDEIWKAGPAIQNSLLTALNEKIFRNGRDDIKLPLKGIIAASNELPAQGEGLEALWDRFLVRYIVNPISEKGNFLSLLAGRTDIAPSVTEEMQFSSGELAEILKLRDEVSVPEEVLEFLYSMRTKYAKRAQEQLKDKAAAGPGANGNAPDPDDEEETVPYVSDRRWKKIVGILRTSALLNGRDSVDWSDCLLLEHLLWDTDIQVGMVQDDIAKEIVKAVLKDTSGNPSKSVWKSTISTAAEPERRPEKKFWSPDGGVHYAFEVGGELMYITAEDYDKLGPARKNGRFRNGNEVEVTDSAPEFTIRRMKPWTVTVNNFTYPVRLEGAIPAGDVGGFLGNVLRGTASAIEELTLMVNGNLFTRSMSEYASLSRELHRYQGSVNKSLTQHLRT